jgi:hypothetical protein
LGHDDRGHSLYVSVRSAEVQHATVVQNALRTERANDTSILSAHTHQQGVLSPSHLIPTFEPFSSPPSYPAAPLSESKIQNSTKHRSQHSPPNRDTNIQNPLPSHHTSLTPPFQAGKPRYQDHPFTKQGLRGSLKSWRSRFMPSAM